MTSISLAAANFQPPRFSRLQVYGVVVAAVIVAWLLTSILKLFDTSRFIFFLTAVIVSASSGGFYAGILATALSVIAIKVSFFLPLDWVIFDGESLTSCLVFVVVSVVVSWREDVLMARRFERMRLYQAEQKARQAAELANETKGRFLAMVSHELRTPLTSIKGFTTILLEDELLSADIERKYLTIVDEEADRLQAMIAQLLDMTRIEAGTMSIRQQRCFPSNVIAAARTRIAALTTGHCVQIDVANSLPLMLADQERITQVITNLRQCRQVFAWWHGNCPQRMARGKIHLFPGQRPGRWDTTRPARDSV
jgi:K+-sensing histidine kinase KdpD